jgi:hypothetical protein
LVNVHEVYGKRKWHNLLVLSKWALIFVVEARQRAEGRRQKRRGF